MKILFITIILLSLSACSLFKNRGAQVRDLDDFYTPTGVERLFLTDLPDWANFDQTASCFRSSKIRYLHLDALMKSYHVNFKEALQIQAAFNGELNTLKNNPGKLENLERTLKTEEILFFRAQDKINNKIYFFESPQFERIHLVWADEVLEDSVKEKKLKDFLESKTMDLGIPVLLSFCLTKIELEKKFPDNSIKMITSEFFSIFDEEGKKHPRLGVDLEQLFKKEQKIYLYTQKKISSIEEVKGAVKGIVKILNY